MRRLRQADLGDGRHNHGSKLPLIVWFWAVYLMATHSNGISALQLQKQLGLGSYKSAWLLCAKLRRAMVAPGRAPLAGLIEVDETEIPLRTKADPVCGGGGRSPQGKMFVAGAVEVENDAPGRLRLAAINDFSAASLHGFVAGNVAPGATIKTDGWPSYARAPDVRHEPHVVGAMAAHIVLPWVHRAFQRQDLGARRLSRTAKTASPQLPRRIRVPLQPTPNPPRRVPLPSRNRHPPQATNLQHVDHAGSSKISLSGKI